MTNHTLFTTYTMHRSRAPMSKNIGVARVATVDSAKGQVLGGTGHALPFDWELVE